MYKMTVHIEGCCEEMSNDRCLSEYVNDVCKCEQMVIHLEQIDTRE